MGYLYISCRLPYWIIFLFPVAFHIGLPFYFLSPSILGYLSISCRAPYRVRFLFPVALYIVLSSYFRLPSISGYLSISDYLPYRVTFLLPVTFHFWLPGVSLSRVIETREVGAWSIKEACTRQGRRSRCGSQNAARHCRDRADPHAGVSGKRQAARTLKMYRPQRTRIKGLVKAGALNQFMDPSPPEGPRRETAATLLLSFCAALI